jgi:hypothetical protein
MLQCAADASRRVYEISSTAVASTVAAAAETIQFACLQQCSYLTCVASSTTHGLCVYAAV